jgi:hypothetical protein
MFRWVFILCLFIGLSGLSLSRSKAQTSPSYQYLPWIASPPLAEVIETARIVVEGYPTYYYVLGYVHNLVPVPLEEVQIQIDVTITPYSPDTPLPPDLMQMQFTPALTATLPGQDNPFTFSLYLGKASAELGDLRLLRARPAAANGPQYLPLTIVHIEVAGSDVQGVVRNDNSQAVSQARVVTAAPHSCPWRETVLGSRILAPGEQTAFNRSSFCLDPQIYAAGQGLLSP